MLVTYANFVKIQPIAPHKRARPKPSNLLVILIEPLSFNLIQVRIIDLFLYRKSEGTHSAPLTHLAKHAILAKFSGLNLKSGSHLLALLHIIVQFYSSATESC